VFRKFADEFLTAETGLAYLGENGSRASQVLEEILIRDVSATSYS
jgi:hypothetical protein